MQDSSPAKCVYYTQHIAYYTKQPVVHCAADASPSASSSGSGGHRRDFREVFRTARREDGTDAAESDQLRFQTSRTPSWQSASSASTGASDGPEASSPFHNQAETARHGSASRQNLWQNQAEPARQGSARWQDQAGSQGPAGVVASRHINSTSSQQAAAGAANSAAGAEAAAARQGSVALAAQVQGHEQELADQLNAEKKKRSMSN